MNMIRLLKNVGGKRIHHQPQQQFRRRQKQYDPNAFNNNLSYDERFAELNAQQEFYQQHALDYYKKHAKRYFVDPSKLEIRYQSAVVGRGVYATDVIPAGEKLVESHAYAFVVVYEQRHKYCHNCLTPLYDIVTKRLRNRESSKCDDCDYVVYCSTECREEHHYHHKHSLECQHLQNLTEYHDHVNPEFHKNDKMSTMHMQIKVFGNRYTEMLQKDQPSDKLEYEDYERLVSNRKKYASVKDRIEVRELASVLLNHVIHKKTKHRNTIAETFSKGLDAPEIIESICKERTNAVSMNGDVWNRPDDYPLIKPDDSIAYGVFPAMAYFNHSCSPNCELIEKDQKIYIYAVDEILPGTELTISYVDLDSNNERRKHSLQGSFLFQCQCPPESTGKNCNQQFLNKHICPKCRGGLLIPVKENESSEAIPTCFDCGYPEF
jgi:RNase P subunit RPR2